MEEKLHYTATLCTWNNWRPAERVLKIQVTYPISVFTEDVLQLKVSMSNACRRANYQHDDKKTSSCSLRQLFRCPPTLCVEEVKSLGNVPDNLTGLQLIKVLSVLDVCKNGTWRKRIQLLVTINNAMKTSHPEKPGVHRCNGWVICVAFSFYLHAAFQTPNKNRSCLQRTGSIPRCSCIQILATD